MKNSNVTSRIFNFNQDREPERLALKYKAMSANPFAFFRGTCHLFYEDWSHEGVLDAAPLAWICGDMHLENFGSFKGDNRLTYFDMNDFDEAILAPCTWETARLLTSILIAAESLKVNRPEAIALCHCFLDSYTAALVDGKARWIERSTADGMIKSLLQSLKQCSREQFLNSRTVLVGGKRSIREDGKKALPVSDADYSKIALFMNAFAASQSVPGFFKVRGISRRIAGTGSLGIERYVILIKGYGDPHGNLLLDLKQARPSALSPYLKNNTQPSWLNEAERVVTVQKRVQAISPAFLSAQVITGKPYILRELLPSQDRLRLELWNGKLRRLENVMNAMGKLIAWGHLRSSGRQGAATADELIEFAQNQGTWRKPLLEYAEDYAQHVVTDWQAFSQDSEVLNIMNN